MKGREEGAGRAAMPAWLRQGNDVVSTTEPCVERWGCFPRSPLPAKGSGGEAPAPLGLSGFHRYSFLKAICGFLATPSIPGRALQLNSWLQWTPSCMGIGCICKLGRSHPKGTHPARQAALPARSLGHSSCQTQRRRLARPRSCERLSTLNSC